MDPNGKIIDRSPILLSYDHYDYLVKRAICQVSGQLAILLDTVSLDLWVLDRL